MRRPIDKPPTADKVVEFPRRKSGRASFDADGRSIWEWQTATGVFERDVTSEQLAKLEDSNLSILEDEQTTGTIYDDRTPTKTNVRLASVPKAPAPKTVLSRLLKKISGH